MGEMPRPFGVLILVIIYVILAVLRFAAILMVMLAESTGGSLTLFCLAPNLILGIFYLLIAMGLYALKGWAWTLALVFAILSMVYAVLNIYGISYSIDLVGEIDISSAFLVIPVVALVLNFIVLLVLLRNKDLFD